VVEVETGDEVICVGTAGAFCGAAKHIVEDYLADLVLGLDVRDHERLWQRMYRTTVRFGRRGATVAAISAVDIACWDAHDAPDVFPYNFNPSDLSLEKYGANSLINWTKYLNADPKWKASFSSQDLSTLTYSGDTVAIPDDQSSALIYYNKSLFTKAGISTFPTTWTQFFADAKKLQTAGITPISLYTADDAWQVWLDTTA
jgi:Bacterial extracellular solute-binding protein/Mandelate racemase / muconate lactonizing enzyme, N-terminal domain